MPNTDPLMAAQKADSALAERRNAFIVEYGDLVKKHGMDFASYPVWQPDGKGGWVTILQSMPMDISNASVKSPFIV